MQLPIDLPHFTNADLNSLGILDGSDAFLNETANSALTIERDLCCSTEVQSPNASDFSESSESAIDTLSTDSMHASNSMSNTCTSGVDLTASANTH